MLLVLTATFGVCLWIVLWAVGLKSFDAFLILGALVLLAATAKSLLPFLPGNKTRD